MFPWSERAVDSESFTPFLTFPSKVRFNTEFASLEPREYQIKEDPINGILTKKRKAIRAIALPGPDSLLSLGAGFATVDASKTVLVSGSRAQKEEDEEMKTIDPAYLSEYESKHPTKKKTILPGHNLRARIFKQLQS